MPTWNVLAARRGDVSLFVSLAVALLPHAASARTLDDECTTCATSAARRMPIADLSGYAFTELAGPITLVRGGFGGRFVTPWLFVGGGGMSVTEQAALAPPVDLRPQRVDIGAGGVLVEMSPFRAWPIRPAAGVFFGTGNVDYRTSLARPYPATKLTMWIPRITFESTPIEGISIGLTGSQRFITGPELTKALTSDLTRPDLYAFLRVRRL